MEGDLVLIRSEEWSRLSDNNWHIDWSRLISGDIHTAAVSGAHARLLDGRAAVEVAAPIRSALRADGGVHDV